MDVRPARDDLGIRDCCCPGVTSRKKKTLPGPGRGHRVQPGRWNGMGHRSRGGSRSSRQTLVPAEGGPRAEPRGHPCSPCPTSRVQIGIKVILVRPPLRLLIHRRLTSVLSCRGCGRGAVEVGSSGPPRQV